MDILHAISAILKHWLAGITVATVVTAAVAIMRWMKAASDLKKARIEIREAEAREREADARATRAEIELAELQKKLERQNLKDRIADFIRTNSGAVAGTVAETFKIALGEAVGLMMELEQENRIWHTNRATWMFGPKPPFLS